MKVQGFEDLHVYQRAREVTNRIYELTRNNSFARDFRLVDQIRGASVSIMSNIAEGFERGTNAEFVQFLYVAKGSSGEIRAQLTVAFDQSYISRADYHDLNSPLPPYQRNAQQPYQLPATTSVCRQKTSNSTSEISRRRTERGSRQT